MKGGAKQAQREKWRVDSQYFDSNKSSDRKRSSYSQEGEGPGVYAGIHVTVVD